MLSVEDYKSDMFEFNYMSFKFIYKKNGFTTFQSEKILSIALNSEDYENILLSDVFIYEWASEVFNVDGATSKYLALNLMYNACCTTEFIKIRAIDYINIIGDE